MKLLLYDRDRLYISYTYDTWGKVLSVRDGEGNAITGINNIANRNPLRYRGYVYDSETKLYYCQSRYYDPQIRRFINADGYVSTGTGFDGYNMFAYCNNNPVMFSDPNGTDCICIHQRVGPRHKCNSQSRELALKQRIESRREDKKQCATRSSTQTVSQSKPSSSVALYDNDRFRDDNAWHEQLFAAELSAPSLNLDEGNVGLGSASADFYTGGWEFDYVDLSLVDIGHAEISAKLDGGNLQLGAMASAYHPTVTLDIFDLFSVEVGAHLGSIGGGVSFGSSGIKVEGSFGSGLSIAIKWD